MVIGNAVRAIISQNNRLYLYKAGDTSGWGTLAWKDSYSHSAHAPTVSYGTSTMTITQDANHAGIAYVLADVSNYTTVVAKGNFTANSNTSNGLYVIQSISGGSYYPTVAVRSQQISGNGTQTLSLDVSSLSGQYYISFGLARSGGVNTVFVISEVYLE